MTGSEPVWLQRRVLLAVHEKLLAEHGGSAGLRDQEMLDSALERPKNKWHYENADSFTLAAAYAFGLAKNHPFADGNKRTAFMAAYIFLHRNGYRFNAPEAEVVVTVTALAAGEITEQDFAVWLEKNCAHE